MTRCLAHTVVALSLALATSALAQDLSGSDGCTYDVTCNENGAILTPRSAGEVVYLGRACDAFSRKLGTGTWGQANGGVLVEFSGTGLGFARQELTCPPGSVPIDLQRCPL